MYIPYTANAILEGNKDPKAIQIKLTGVLIGNGRINTDPAVTGNAMMTYFINRNLFDPTTRAILEN